MFFLLLHYVELQKRIDCKYMKIKKILFSLWLFAMCKLLRVDYFMLTQSH